MRKNILLLSVVGIISLALAQDSTVPPTETVPSLDEQLEDLLKEVETLVPVEEPVLPPVLEEEDQNPTPRVRSTYQEPTEENGDDLLSLKTTYYKPSSRSYTYKPSYTYKSTYTYKPATYTYKPATYTYKPATYTYKPITYTYTSTYKPISYTPSYTYSTTYTYKPSYTYYSSTYNYKPITYTYYTSPSVVVVQNTTYSNFTTTTTSSYFSADDILNSTTVDEIFNSTTFDEIFNSTTVEEIFEESAEFFNSTVDSVVEDLTNKNSNDDDYLYLQFANQLIAMQGLDEAKLSETAQKALVFCGIMTAFFLAVFALIKLRRKNRKMAGLKEFKQPLTTGDQESQEKSNKYQQYLDFIQNCNVQTETSTIAYVQASPSDEEIFAAKASQV